MLLRSVLIRHFLFPEKKFTPELGPTWEHGIQKGNLKKTWENLENRVLGRNLLLRHRTASWDAVFPCTHTVAHTNHAAHTTPHPPPHHSTHTPLHIVHTHQNTSTHATLRHTRDTTHSPHTYHLRPSHTPLLRATHMPRPIHTHTPPPPCTHHSIHPYTTPRTQQNTNTHHTAHRYHPTPHAHTAPHIHIPYTTRVHTHTGTIHPTHHATCTDIPQYVHITRTLHTAQHST